MRGLGIGETARFGHWRTGSVVSGHWGCERHPLLAGEVEVTSVNVSIRSTSRYGLSRTSAVKQRGFNDALPVMRRGASNFDCPCMGHNLYVTFPPSA